MLENTLAEFWMQLRVSPPPSTGSDYSVEIDGVGRVTLNREAGSLALAGFLPDETPRNNPVPAMLVLTDYRNQHPDHPLHPVLSENLRTGFLTMLPENTLTPQQLMQKFEQVCDSMEKIAAHNPT
jgi:hypothetical protein